MKTLFFCLALSLSLLPGLASADDSTASTDNKNVITAVDPTNHTIEVSRAAHKIKTNYILASDVVVQIPGNNSATVTDLKVGMVVQSMRLDSGIDDPATIEEIDIEP
jgi:hypothetical protein